MIDDKPVHIPVLVDEVIDLLNAKAGGYFLDCTLGNGGHALAILGANESNRLSGIDRDFRAIERVTQRLSGFGKRFSARKGKFSEISHFFDGSMFDGVLADLGMSTNQLEENRGFAFDDTSPLDMKMDEGDSISALDIISNSSESDLYRIFKEGGVGSEANVAVRAIVKNRPFESTMEFSKVLNKALSSRVEAKSRNPCTVIFQALRMAVNKEIWELEELMKTIPKIIRNGGRAAIISFHSLEDKIVTRAMRTWEGGGEFSASFPGATRSKPIGRLITRKAIKPSEEEVSINPQSRSARLRAFEFIL